MSSIISYENKIVNGTSEKSRNSEAFKGLERYVAARQARKSESFLAWNRKVPETGTEKFKKVIEEKYNVKL
ncbi:acetoacetyl-CoA synthetase, partial [Trichonephila inaurata madagascariensis]